jgi:hypothetical protein
VTEKVPVDLSGAAQTMLATLYLKALDADFDRPVLGDRYAKEAVSRLDYDFREIGITARWAPLITVRTSWPFTSSAPSCISGAVWIAGCSGWIPVRTCSGTTSTTPP